MAGFNYLWSNRAKHQITSKKFFAAWAKRFLTFPELVKRNRRRWQLVNRGANIDQTAEVGQVEIGGRKSNLSIGSMSFIGKVQIALHEKVTIGNNVCINDGVIILTASHNLNDPLWHHVKAPIIIDDYAWVATNAIILPGVHIGTGAVVGAGAVVSKNVEPYNIVAGNPAQPLRKKRIEELTYDPCSLLAANQAWLKG